MKTKTYYVLPRKSSQILPFPFNFLFQCITAEHTSQLNGQPAVDAREINSGWPGFLLSALPWKAPEDTAGLTPAAAFTSHPRGASENKERLITQNTDTPSLSQRHGTESNV